jgi:glycosyltransferase involved in cell wall biosynthesis
MGSVTEPEGRADISVVVPAYNEAKVLPEFHRRLAGVLDSLGTASEVVYVNDGSTDETLSVLQRLRASDKRVAIVDLSRNFGKEIALTAGLDHAVGDAVVVVDADLQDPPELIPELVAHWREGYDVVYAQRRSRAGETFFKKTSAAAFYRIMQKVGAVDLPRQAGDFRLLSRPAVEAVKQVREQHRFMKGLFAWVGFPQKAVLYDRDPRAAGSTKWTYWKLWNLSLEGITSFTIAPLKLATYLGLVTAVGAFFYGMYIIVDTLVFGNPVPGYPSLMVVVLFLGGIQLIFLGIVGEYLGRVFNETKRRPLYFVKDPPLAAGPRSQSVPRQRAGGARRERAASPHD